MGHDPIVDEFFVLAAKQGHSIREVADKAGLAHTTLYRWRTREPGLMSMRAALNSLGYDIEIRRIK